MSEREMANQTGDAAVSRREILRSVALSLLAAGAGVPLAAEAAQHVHQAASEEKKEHIVPSSSMSTNSRPYAGWPS
jgi:hypothetical protein